MNVRFEPPFLPLQTAALALIGVGAAFALYLLWERRQRARRNLPLLLLRSLTVLALAFLLLNPVLNIAQPKVKEKSPFFILLDTSRSMTTPDVPKSSNSHDGKNEQTRWEAAKQATLGNREMRDELERRYNVRFYGFDSQAKAQPPDALNQLTKPDGDRTALADALQQVIGATAAESPTGAADATPVRGGVLLVSDGRDNGTTSPLETARQARALGFPVYTLCLGREQKGRDIQVVAKRPQAFAAPGQTIEVTTEIRNSGIAQANVRVDLLREGRRVATQTVATTPGIQDVTFSVMEPHGGFFRYALAASPVAGETNSANNRANVFLNVMDARSHVLLLEGSPSWDAKFLAQTLRDDPTIVLDSIFQLTPTRPFALSGDANRPTLSMPRTVEELSHYDVILVGKGFESFFDAAGTEALKKWIGDRGGHLVLLRGRADERTPALRELEPVTFSETQIETARVRLTEAGRSHPGFAFSGGEDAQTVVQKLPMLVSATRVTGEKALAVVLARTQSGEGSAANAQEMAMLAYQRYGQGKVMAIVGQGLWQWAFLPSDQEQYSRVYKEFWTQTIRWLVSESDFLPGQNLALRTDRSSYSLKETVNLMGYIRGQKPASLPNITVTQPNGKTTTVAPAKGDGKAADFAATYRPPMAGEYVATVAPLSGNPKAVPISAAFTVYPGQEEDANRSADPMLMRQIAATGGGQALQFRDLPTLAEKLRAQELSAVRNAEPKTAWDRWWVLALLVSLLTSEWLLRRRAGLA
jgi:hypothetical protein